MVEGQPSIETYSRRLYVNYKPVRLEILAISSGPNQIHDTYYDMLHAGDIFMFVYNPSSRTSFLEIQDQPQVVYSHRRTGTVPVMIVAHELVRNWGAEVSIPEAKENAALHDCAFAEVYEGDCVMLEEALVEMVKRKWAYDGSG